MAESPSSASPSSANEPPAYAVIFTSRRSRDDGQDYLAVAERMAEVAAEQPGFLGMTSLRDAQGLGVTISYWTDRQSIAKWRDNAEHRVAQTLGRQLFYDDYSLEVCRIETRTTYVREPGTAEKGECR